MAGCTRGGSPERCPSCGASVLTQWVGDSAALKVTADAEPIPPAQAHAMKGPNRLVWCLATLRGGLLELRWRCRSTCGHGAVIEHRCPPEAKQYGRRPEGAMW
ncbi:hypothetical protein OHB14_36510 [Streptomyces sp. NBC_01613]|uniref:hypothetical protein n=1 Tax=Streptomyces sp. NBC_01613 TaxID=2975896 RepID=UPI00386D08E6